MRMYAQRVGMHQSCMHDECSRMRHTANQARCMHSECTNVKNSHQFRAETPPHPGLFRPYAAWTKNTSIKFAGFGFSAHATNPTDEKMPYRPHSVLAIDIADFLRRRVREDDYVVVKMDVEGAEVCA